MFIEDSILIFLFLCLFANLNTILFYNKNTNFIETLSLINDFFSILYISYSLKYDIFEDVFYTIVFLLSQIIRLFFSDGPFFICNKIINSVLFIIFLITYECCIIVIFDKTLCFDMAFFQFIKFLSIIFHPYSMYFHLYAERGFYINIYGVHTL